MLPPPSPPWAVQTDIDAVAARITATAEGLLFLTPGQALAALTLPEGAPIFRVRNRTVVDGDAEPRVQRDEVTFVAPMRVLFWKAWAATTVAQRADVSAGDERVTVDFNLLHSDLMSRLEGRWEFELVRPAAPRCGPAAPLDEGCWPLTRVRYTFSMWPKGVPTALRRIPGLMDAVRGTVARESTALLDKLAFVASRMSHPSGSVRTALRLACGEVERAGSYKRLASRSGTAAAAALVAPAGAGGTLRGPALSAHRLSFSSSATSSADYAAALAGLADAIAGGRGGGGAAAAAAAAAAVPPAEGLTDSHTSSGDDADFASCCSGESCDLTALNEDLELNISNASSDVDSARGNDAGGRDQRRAAEAKRRPMRSRLGRKAAASAALDVPLRRSRAAAVVRAWMARVAS